MGFPTKVQLIKRKKSQQWYINFPAAVAQAMEFQRGEVVEWSIENKALLVLKRTQIPDSPLKKKPNKHSSIISNSCSKNAKPLSSSKDRGKGQKGSS